jgi:SET domain-containing protein
MDSRKVIVRRTKKYGKAVFAQQTIRKGEVIAAFDGPFYDDDFDQWTEDLLNHAIQYAKTDWRDSKGIARWINHSCEPNCGIKDYFKVVAMRKIEKGEQITWDYEMTEKNDTWKMKCRCGSPGCRKIIGNYKNMPRQIRKKYAGYISDWLLPKSRRSK